MEEILRALLKLFDEAMQLAETDAIRQRVEKVSVTALRLALEPVWWNVIEAPRRSQILKTTIEQERVEIREADLPRYRKMTLRLFSLTDKHKLGGAPRERILSYLQIPNKKPVK